METVIGIVIGLIIGGVAMWFAAKSRTASRMSSLQSEAALAKERQAASESTAERIREEAEKWENQRKSEISDLQERVATLELGKTKAEQVGDELRSEIKALRDKAAIDEPESARLQAELNATSKQLAERTDIEKVLLDKFKAMASEIAISNNESFLSVADEKVGGIVKPLTAELKRIETARNESQGNLTEQISALLRNNESLREGTRKLTQALTNSQASGKWGEIQLKRIAELAGMVNYCDFQVQSSVRDENGKVTGRLDMVVRMPSGRAIVVDAKTPTTAYMESLKADSDNERQKALRKNAEQVRKHARDLAKKSYWDKLDQSPEFVVMFLPLESLLQSALEVDPELFDQTVRNGVIIATPNTLIALLKTVEMGWREAKIAQDARTIANLGSELYGRLATYFEHISNVGGALRSAVLNYNKAVGSFDTRVSVSVRRLRDLGVSTDKTVPEMKRIDEPVSRSNAKLKATNANGRQSKT